MKTKSVSKLLAICLAVVMLVGLLAACGNDSGSNNNSNTGGDTQVADDNQGGSDNTGDTGSDTGSGTTTGDVPTLIWWVIGGTPPDNWDEMVAQVSDYSEEKIGVRIDVKVAGWGEAGDRFNQIVNTGEYFDLMFVNDGNYNKYVTLGALADITDLVPSVSPELWDFIPEDLWDATRVKGQIYAVPTYKDSSMTQYWGIDKLYVDKYDLDMSSVHTFADIDKVFRTIKEGEGANFYPHMAMRSDPWNGFFNNYDNVNSGLGGLIGVRIDDDTRKVVCTYEQDDILEQLNYVHQWYVDGITNPDANIIDETGTGHENAVFLNAQGWPEAAVNWATNSKIDEYVLTGPINGPLYTTATIQGSMNAISASSNYKEEALKVLQLMNTDKQFRTMCYKGPEGVGFDWVDDNTIKVYDVSWVWPNYQQGTFFIEPNEEGASGSWLDEVLAQNEAAIGSPCLGFMMDREGWEDRQAILSSAYDKYTTDLLSGAADPDEMVPRMLEDLYSQGLQEYIDELQRQVDEFFGQ